MLEIITFIYLGIQSYYDSKYMKVPIFINNIMLIVSLILYGIDFAIKKITIEYFMISIIVMIVLYIMYKFHMYGSGDLKALVVIYLNIRYIAKVKIDTAIFLLLCVMFIANIILIIFHKIIKNKNNRVAYFPCLTIGYFLIMIGRYYFE